MATNSQPPKDQSTAISSINWGINITKVVGSASSNTPVKAVFTTVSFLLSDVKDYLKNEEDYGKLELDCDEICNALGQATEVDDLDEAVSDLKLIVAEIRDNVKEKKNRKRASRFFHAGYDKDVITGLKSKLDRILNVFQTKLAINTRTRVSETLGVAYETRDDVDKSLGVTYEILDDVDENLGVTYKIRDALDETRDDVFKTLEVSTKTHDVASNNLGVSSTILNVTSGTRVDLSKTNDNLSENLNLSSKIHDVASKTHTIVLSIFVLL